MESIKHTFSETWQLTIGGRLVHIRYTRFHLKENDLVTKPLPVTKLSFTEHSSDIFHIELDECGKEV